MDAAILGARVLVEPCLFEAGGKELDSSWCFGSECDGGFAEDTVVAAPGMLIRSKAISVMLSWPLFLVHILQPRIYSPEQESLLVILCWLQEHQVVLVLQLFNLPGQEARESSQLLHQQSLTKLWNLAQNELWPKMPSFLVSLVRTSLLSLFIWWHGQTVAGTSGSTEAVWKVCHIRGHCRPSSGTGCKDAPP